jgi:hypothetical protein
MEKRLTFDFIPLMPSAAAWNNRLFKQPVYSEEELFAILKNYEKSLGFGKYLDGYIYFKEGHYSDYYDGSYNRKPYHEYRWWETEAKSCHKGCCTIMPNNWDPVTRTYGVEEWKKGFYGSGAVWYWCSCQKEKRQNSESPISTAPCKGHPRSEPVQVKPVMINPVEQKITVQEFRRIYGPGGAEEQFKEIKNKEGVAKIWLTGIGWWNLLCEDL